MIDGGAVVAFGSVPGQRHFDESERVTHSEIAEKLGISRSSLSERLRRAEQELVRKQLESPP